MQFSLKKIISGAVCMAFVISSIPILGNVVADAVNLETSITVNAIATATLENGLEYEVYEDYVEITGYDESAGSEVIIPETIEGLPVTSIGGIAFYDCSSLTSVIIPDGVTGIEYDAFSGCTSLTSVTIPNSVTEIETGAFYRCSSLASITIPDNVKDIGNGAFSSSSLTSIIIPDSVKDIGNGAFSDCSSLTAIHVDSKNKNYMDIDGVLFSKGQKTLHQYPAGKLDQSYSVPDNVTYIDDFAFCGCSALESVTIPNSVTDIGGNAFYGCSALESVTILNKDCEISNSMSIEKNATIYGYAGSTAEAYAEKYNREFVALDENPVNSEILWGDANHDNTVDISDVVLMNRVYVGVDHVSDEDMKNADVDQSGKIELSDSMNVLKLLVHLLDQSDFPIQA